MKKNTVIIIVLVAVLAAVIGGAAIGYALLSNRIAKPQPAQSTIADESYASDETYIAGEEEEETQDIAATGKALAFTVIDGDGNAVKLSEHFGKPIVVNFWATWCPPCQSELPHFETLYREMGDEVTFMMVDLTDGVRESSESTKRFAAENGYTFPIYYDDEGSAAFAYNITSIPLTLFIDAEGNLVARQLGAMDEATLRAYIEEIR